MAEPKTIAKGSPPYASMDYEALRRLGMDHLEKLSGKIWTDFNAHDPGVTLLEVLAYAITDLGYRTSWPIEDLLASGGKPVTEQFPSAREILPCNPVTLLDYRKLMVDVEGIKNAWLEPTQDHYPPLYLDKKKSSLSYLDRDINGQVLHPVVLNGLYQVIFEFEDAGVLPGTEELGDLNDNTVEYDFVSTIPQLAGLEFKIEVAFKPWDEVSDKQPLESFITHISPENKEIRLADYTVLFSPKKLESNELPFWKMEVKVYDTQALDVEENVALSTALEKELKGVMGFIEDLSVPLPIVKLYRRKIDKIREVIKEVKIALHKRRNLDEDFVAYRSLRVEEIGICADIEITNQSDVERVQADIYFAIEQFLSPRIQFYGLEEMFEKGYTSEQIFEGPALENGFIDESELSLADRRRIIHVSDIIRIIMAVKGVTAIRNIQIANFPKIDNPNILQKSVKWCLELAYDQNYVPRLGIDYSRLIFFKDSLPYTGNQEEVSTRLADLRLQEQKKRNPEPTLNIAFPTGKQRALGSYYSIQHHLPQTYGVGNAGLPKSSSEARKAQAIQLQGYLAFFEQLLADYYAQLRNLPTLFGSEEGTPRTYFSQSLVATPGMERLVIPFISGREDLEEKDLTAAWEAWASDENNEYIQEVERISESQSGFDDRRNRFLDHLLSRFNEQFSDYALLLYSIEGKRTPEELIEDKAAFFQHYPKLSAERGTGFDYFGKGNVWDTPNVTGLEQRVGRLLGIDNTDRRNLALPQNDLIEVYEDQAGLMRWRIFDEEGILLLRADKGYVPEEIYEILGQVLVRGITPTQFRDRTTQSKQPRYFFNILDAEDDIIAQSKGYKTKKERNQAKEDVAEYLRTLDINNQFSAEEGMHVVEHLLLRPRTTLDNFLPVCVEEDCDECQDVDPYSFRISVILPAYSYRFRNMDFRKFVERTIRMETPAHILSRICWISPAQMAEFEDVYQAWLETLNEVNQANFDLPVNQLELNRKDLCLKSDPQIDHITNHTLYRGGEFLDTFLALMKRLPCQEGIDMTTEFGKAVTQLNTVGADFLSLEQTLHALASQNDYHLGQAIRYDDIRRLGPYLEDDEEEGESKDKEIFYKFLEELEALVLLVAKNLQGGKLKDPYQRLVLESSALNFSRLRDLATLTPEPLDPNLLHQEMLHMAFYEAYTKQLARLEGVLDVTAGLTREEFAQLSPEGKRIALSSAIALDQLRQHRLTQRQNELVVVLMSLRNIYPSAVLHDCEESDTSQRPVSLDNTVLGSFSPTVTPDNDGSDV